MQADVLLCVLTAKADPHIVHALHVGALPDAVAGLKNHLALLGVER